MANGKFVTYYRVSTQKQGQSGLGIEAQQQLVQAYLNGGEWTVLGEFTEVETGKGADALATVSYTHLTLPTKEDECRSRWSPYH